jgi:hypothetical protein
MGQDQGSAAACGFGRWFEKGDASVGGGSNDLQRGRRVRREDTESGTAYPAAIAFVVRTGNFSALQSADRFASRGRILPVS